MLVARSGAGEVDRRTRLLVARAPAAFRVWLDDLGDGAGGDPLRPPAEVLDLR